MLTVLSVNILKLETYWAGHNMIRNEIHVVVAKKKKNQAFNLKGIDLYFVSI